MGLHKLQKTMEQIFAHPLSTNMEWKDVEHLLEHLGFTLEHTKKNHVKVKNEEGKELVLIVHNHELGSKDEITKLKHFLLENGISADTTL